MQQWLITNKWDMQQWLSKTCNSELSLVSKTCSTDLSLVIETCSNDLSVVRRAAITYHYWDMQQRLITIETCSNDLSLLRHAAMTYHYWDLQQWLTISKWDMQQILLCVGITALSHERKQSTNWKIFFVWSHLKVYFKFFGHFSWKTYKIWR